MNADHIYEAGLGKNHANYTPLSPLTFLERAASVYPQHDSIIYGDTHYKWSETYSRCRRLASALKNRGLAQGDTVAVMLPNVPAIYEVHFGVAMAGAVLNALNIRLNADTIAFMLQHAEAKIILTDREFSDVIGTALSKLENQPLVIDVDDPAYEGGDFLGDIEYETFLQQGTPDFDWCLPDDEWDAISLNYTSGTTGDPKGVVYHHRGAYLNAISNMMFWKMPVHPVYLWTLPMFHCNGWCFPWTIAAMAGTNVCLRNVREDAIYDLIKKEKVDHLCGAPIVLNLMANAAEDLKQGIGHKVNVMTAGAAPPAAVLEAMQKIGFEVTHAYGLTETFGPAAGCAWQNEWDKLPILEQSGFKSRQGVRYPMLEGLMVADPDTMEPVEKDGKTMGEIFFQGNIVMKGYLKNPESTDKALKGGWFHSGDLAVWHEDGYIQIKDRSKDIIISGGENISSIEVEGVLYRHPKVLEAAVVARPDEKWGETPCAFVALKDGEELTAEELIAFCRENIEHFKAPKTVVFGPLPKTSTGKIQKFKLREQASKLAD
jgi:3-(methylthio)propionyl---CoA ligase